MELETIRCIVAGATDGTIGINAMIDALTLEVGDSAPPHVNVYDSVRHGWVARKAFSTDSMNVTLPAMAIFVGKTADLDANVMTVVRDGHWPITFAYLDAKSATETGTYNALQTNRAILKFLSRFVANGNLAQRTRNGIIVQALTELGQPPIAAVKDDVFIGAATEATFLVRETAP